MELYPHTPYAFMACMCTNVPLPLMCNYGCLCVSVVEEVVVACFKAYHIPILMKNEQDTRQQPIFEPHTSQVLEV